MDDVTIEDFRAALPDACKRSLNVAVIDQIQAKLDDPDLYEVYRDNLLGYAQVMKEGKFKLSGYIDAVKYISHKLMGKTNIAAFTITFPDKIKRWELLQVEAKDIASYVTSYNKSKLVALLYEQTLTPFWVMNQDMYQKALNVQAELMITANSEKVRTDAANSLLTHLKPPEVKKVELDIGIKQDSTIMALRASTEALVEQQQAMLTSGAMSAQEIANTRLIVDAELVDEDETAASNSTGSGHGQENLAVERLETPASVGTPAKPGGQALPGLFDSSDEEDENEPPLESALKSIFG